MKSTYVKIAIHCKLQKQEKSKHSERLVILLVCSMAIWSTRMQDITLHEIWSFPLRIFSVNVNESAVSCWFSDIYWKNPKWKISYFVQCNSWCSCRIRHWFKGESNGFRSSKGCISKKFLEKFPWHNIGVEWFIKK